MGITKKEMRLAIKVQAPNGKLTSLTTLSSAPRELCCGRRDGTETICKKDYARSQCSYRREN